MDPAAVPFNLSPTSFTITIFVLVLVMFISLSVIRYTQPRLSYLWNFFSISITIKAKKLHETAKNHSASKHRNWVDIATPEISTIGGWDMEKGVLET
jgi:hypothetical protein